MSSDNLSAAAACTSGPLHRTSCCTGSPRVPWAGLLRCLLLPRVPQVAVRVRLARLLRPTRAVRLASAVRGPALAPVWWPGVFGSNRPLGKRRHTNHGRSDLWWTWAQSNPARPLLTNQRPTVWAISRLEFQSCRAPARGGHVSTTDLPARALTLHHDIRVMPKRHVSTTDLPARTLIYPQPGPRGPAIAPALLLCKGASTGNTVKRGQRVCQSLSRLLHR